MKEDKRNHRIKTDYGSLDYYRFFIKEYGMTHISRNVYGKIIREFNEHIRDRISTRGAEYILPHRMGKIELRKVKREVKLDDEGKVINNLPTNWKETRALWRDNPKAKEKKTKIRYTNEHTDGYTFRIFFRKARAHFKNKSIYKMRFNRTLKRQLSESIFAGKIDAFLK